MKRFAVIILVLLLLLTLCACDKPKTEEVEETEYIGIVSAMDNEIAELITEADIERTDNIGSLQYYVGKLKGKPVVITKCGIGKVRSSAGVTAMFNNYRISKVIFTGIAGGVADETKVMDQVIATKLVEHDYGMITNDGFIWLSGDPGMATDPGVYYDTDLLLTNLAYDCAVEVLGEEHVFKGVIATGDQFIASEDYVERLQNDYNAYACEMEGASVAVICIQYNIPFAVIRCLSDKADGAAHDSYENFGDVAAANSSAIVLKMLEKI